MSIHSVLIPTIDDEYDDHKLWQVYCRPANQEELTEASQQKNQDRLIPTLTPLLAIQYYEQSLKPYMAVQKNLEADLLPELENKRLCSGDGGEWVTQIDGESSDLGIALCLLMSVTNSKHQLIAATGALGDAQDHDKLQDSVVKPVAGVKEKLQQLLKKAPSDLKIIITPHQHLIKKVIKKEGDKEGKEVEVLDSVINLPEVKQLQERGIEVKCVATLSEAVNYLHLFNTYQRFKKRLRWLLFGGLSAVLLCALTLAFNLYRPIQLDFVAMQKNLGTQPFIVCYNAEQKPYYLAIGKDRIVPNNAELGWLLQIGSQDETNALPYQVLKWLGYTGVKPTLVLISNAKDENTNIHAILEPDNKNRVLALGRKWAYSWQLKPENQDEELLLAILINRNNALDIEKLRREWLNRHLSLDVIENKLRQTADGAVTFRFIAKTGAKHCETQTP